MVNKILDEQRYPVGSWVAFYQGGSIVIGEVRYHNKRKIGFREDEDVCTTVGSVSSEYILEVRRKPDA